MDALTPGTYLTGSPFDGSAPVTFDVNVPQVAIGVAHDTFLGQGLFVVTDPTYGATGDGTTDDRAAFAAAQTACGANGVVFVPPGTYRIASNLTASSTMRLIPGALLKPDSGVTITFTGPFIAGPYQQAFTGSGTVSFDVGSVSCVHPAWWPDCLPDGSTDCMAAFDGAVSAIYEGGRVHISDGKWKLATPWARSDGKQVDFSIDSIRSVIWLDMGSSNDAITWTGGDFQKAAGAWRLVFGGAAGSCRNGIILGSAFAAKLDIDFLAGTATQTTTTGWSLWIRRSQSNSVHFVASANIHYPWKDTYGAVVPSAGILVAQSDGATAAVSEDNEYDVQFEGVVGLRVIAGETGNGNDVVKGIWEGTDGYGVYYSGGNPIVTEWYSEAGTYSQIILENTTWARVINGNAHGPTGEAPSGEITLLGATGTLIDNVACTILSIDSASQGTMLGRIIYNGQTDAGLVDNSTSTRQLVIVWPIENTSTLVGDALPGINMQINGGCERWYDVNSVPPGWAFGGTWSREGTIVHGGGALSAGRFSAKVVLTTAGDKFGGTAVDATPLPPNSIIGFSGWFYIPTTGGHDLSVDVWWNSGAEVRGLGIITARDEWVQFKVAFNARGTDETRSSWRINVSSASDNATVYVDDWSQVCSVIGPPMGFMPNTNEFPKYTGSVVWDPASIGPGGTLALDVTCPGAALSYGAGAGAGVDVAGIIVSATVKNTDVVTIVLYNPTSGPINLASSRWTVWAQKVVDAP